MPRNTLRTVCLLALFSAIAGLDARAHNPIVIDSGPTDAATAYEVADVSVSRVAYHHARTGQHLLWLTFSGRAGQILDIQMGVPKIDRYGHVRPATAVVGPGLPPAPNLPFAVPQGMGATVVSTENEGPTVFDEEFTGTISWMFEKKSVPLPQDGKYYMVSYLPSGGRASSGWPLARLKCLVCGTSYECLRLSSKHARSTRCFRGAVSWVGLIYWLLHYCLAVCLDLPFCCGGLSASPSGAENSPALDNFCKIGAEDLLH